MPQSFGRIIHPYFKMLNSRYSDNTYMNTPMDEGLGMPQNLVDGVIVPFHESSTTKSTSTTNLLVFEFNPPVMVNEVEVFIQPYGANSQTGYGSVGKFTFTFLGAQIYDSTNGKKIVCSSDSDHTVAYILKKISIRLPLVFRCGQSVSSNKIELFNGGERRLNYFTEVRAVNNNCKTPGFEYSGVGDSFCVDINECETECQDQRYQCTNTIGSYKCACKPEYERNGMCGQCSLANEPDPAGQCWKDSDKYQAGKNKYITGTTLNDAWNFGTPNFVASCREFCKGYRYFGVQGVCFCGDDFNEAAPGTIGVSDQTECDALLCRGQQTITNCGGLYRNRFYKTIPSKTQCTIKHLYRMGDFVLPRSSTAGAYSGYPYSLAFDGNRRGRGGGTVALSADGLASFIFELKVPKLINFVKIYPSTNDAIAKRYSPFTIFGPATKCGHFWR